MRRRATTGSRFRRSRTCAIGRRRGCSAWKAGEILALTRADVDLKRGLLTLGETKNGEIGHVEIIATTRALLERLHRQISGRVVPQVGAYEFRIAWEIAVLLVGLTKPCQRCHGEGLGGASVPAIASSPRTTRCWSRGCSRGSITRVASAPSSRWKTRERSSSSSTAISMAAARTFPRPDRPALPR